MCWRLKDAESTEFWIDPSEIPIYPVDRFAVSERQKGVSCVKQARRDKTTGEAIRIRSVADLHRAIEYIEAMYGTEDAALIFPDCMPVVSAVFVRAIDVDGHETSQLIMTNEWPRGTRPSERYEVFRVSGDEG